MNDSILQRLTELTESGRANRALGRGEDGVDELTAQALEAGVPPGEVLNALMAGMSAIGERFGAGKAFVPNMLMAARAMSAGMAHLKPFFSSGEVQRKGTFIIGTVFGDLHDIGKNLVAMMVEGSGWEVIDLGVDVAPEVFVSAAAKQPHAVIGLSALLTTTMGNMATVIEALHASNPATRVIVGGAPLSHDYAIGIGADGYSSDPAGAVELLNKLVAA